jgi:hypothetical protein
MKKTMLLITTGILFSWAAMAQSIGINNTTPDASAILDVKSNTKGLLIPRMLLADRDLIATPATGLLIFQTDNAPGYYYYNGSSWLQLASGGANNWTLSGNNILGYNIYNNNNGNVGIGTTSPQNKLQIGDFSLAGGFDMAIGNGTQGMVFFQTSKFSGWYSNTNFALAPFAGGNTGYVGIGIYDPFYRLDVGDRMRIRSGSATNTAGIWFNDPGNTNTIAFVGVKSADQVGIYGINSLWGLLMNTNTGYVSIGTPNSAANKLQIGSTNTAGNDIAFGNGSQATGLFQAAGSLNISSTTDILLLPKGNLNGRVGINTYTPRAPLDVAAFASSALTYSYLNGGSYNYGIGLCNNCLAPVSIYASNAVYAFEFDAYSDARIKNIVSISNTAKDLETVNALQVTDYTMKDIVKYGNKPFKKVIAQEVEKVYPQVISTHADFIPNVYQLTDKITQTTNGYLLHFTGRHNISNTAKKLKLLFDETGGMQDLNIISIPSANEVEIDAKDIKIANVFVYGEEVGDFRTVDYEGLSTLNISATQELSKLEQKQQNQIKQLEKRMAILENRLSVSPLPLR